MKVSSSVLLLSVILVILAVLLIAGCKLQCNNNNTVKEGYERSCLGNSCWNMVRTPVDFAMKNPRGWQRNPHYKTDPSNKYQPLEYGPVDFWPDLRRLNENNGELFQQYRNDWKGCGKQQIYLRNDAKNRFDLTAAGNVGARRVLDSLPSKRIIGGALRPHTELQDTRPNPTRGRIYGGSDWLQNDQIGF